jgi:hypothetical protein
MKVYVYSYFVLINIEGYATAEKETAAHTRFQAGEFENQKKRGISSKQNPEYSYKSR